MDTLPLAELMAPEPSRGRRRLTFVLPLLTVIAILGAALGSDGILGVWVIINLATGGVAFLWMLFHLRRMLPAWRLAARWGSAIALISALSFTVFSVENMELRSSALASLLSILSGPALFLVLFPLALAGGFLAAIVADLLTRGVHRDIVLGEHAIRAWSMLILLDLGLKIMGTPNSLCLALAVGLPWETASVCLLLLRPGTDPHRLARLIERALSRVLVLRLVIRGRSLKVDLRGALLGLASAGLVLMVNAVNGLAAPKSWTLISAMQLRNGVAQTIDLARPIQNGRPALPPQLARELDSKLNGMRQIVLLEMDAPILHEILTGGSESEVQARVIDRLHAYGVSQILMIPPLFAPLSSSIQSVHEAPLLDKIDIRRSVHDIPRLRYSIHQAGNVVLAILSHVPHDSVRSISREARAVGTADLVPYHSIRLPGLAIPRLGDLRAAESHVGDPLGDIAHLPAAPLLLFDFNQQAANRSPLIPPSESILPMDKGRALVDFISFRPFHDFQHVSYSSVLSGQSVYAGRSAGEGSPDWLDPRNYFRGKIVFLDSMLQQSRETPLGAIPEMDALAYITAGLLSRAWITPSATTPSVLFVLVLGIAFGALCSRISPVRALWWMAAAAIAMIAYSLTQFILPVRHVWVDPVVPILSLAVTFLLVTQLSLVGERREKDRTRALLERFVSPQILDELLADPDLGLGGRRRQVCVLFADIRNFTPFTEHHSPEEVIELTNLYLTAMTDALFRHGGILDKYTGDGLMAFFRIRNPLIDLEEAIRAAIAMRDAAHTVSQRVDARGLDPLAIGIGMHYGEAVVGLVGSPDRVDYTALGYTVVVSHRLQSIALGGEIVISESVFSNVSTRCHAEEGELVNVKGISVPVRPYRVQSLAGATEDP